MICPVCDGDTTVVDSTSSKRSVYRKRKCQLCGYKFITLERLANVDNFYSLKNKHKKQKGILE